MTDLKTCNEIEIYTLASENYAAGAVSLINSLRVHGFHGKINIGHTGPLSIEKQHIENVRFHELAESAYWIGNRKPEFLLTHPPQSWFAFFDADIILDHSDFLPRLCSWILTGPVFAIEAIVPASDHRRSMWRRRLGKEPYSSLTPEHYYNSGFFAGKWLRDREVIECWHNSLQHALSPPASIFEDHEFPMPDQDVLNAVLQDMTVQPIGVSPPDILYTASPINPFLHVGGFSRPALLHCTGGPKPWTLKTVPPRPPSQYDQAWYRYVFDKNTPVRLTHKLSKPLKWWFTGNKLGRLIQRSKTIAARFR